MYTIFPSLLTIIPAIAKDHSTKSPSTKEEKSSFGLIRVVQETPKRLKVNAISLAYPPHFEGK